MKFSLYFKRFIIVTLFTVSIVVLGVSAEGSLLVNLPDDSDLANIIEQREQVEKEYQELLEQELEREANKEYEDLFDNSVRHTFIIEFTSTEFQGVVDDMLSYQEEYGTLKSNNYRSVQVTYIADDTTQVFEQVGFRTKGDTVSRRLPIDEDGNVQETHFVLKFNETFKYSETSTRYDELKTREAMGIEQLIFKWNQQNDPAHMNEVYSYEMLKRAGVPVPNASFAEVQIVIDGEVELVSFYNIIEQFDEEFIRRHLQDTPTKEVGDLYKAQWSGTLETINDINLYGIRNTEFNVRPLYAKETNKDIYSYDVLINFSYGINDTNKYIRKQYLEENFDIDTFLRTMAMNILLGNIDDYRSNGNNMYYYFDENQFMTFLPSDYDNSLGSGWNGEPTFVNYTLGNDIYHWGFHSWNNFDIPLWNHIIEHEQYQLLYEYYLLEFIDDELFSTETYLELFNTIEELYDDIYTFSYTKEYFITSKINLVRDQVAYYKELRE